jgi:hypothetical protein
LAIWSDPELGVFEYDELGWSREFDLPAFAVFEYGGFSNSAVHAGSSSVTVLIEADDEDEKPTAGMIAVARLAIKNHESLVDQGASALFDDIRGNGPDSGMWWHGAIEHVREIVASRFNREPMNLLTGPTDLRSLLGRPRIIVQQRGYKYDYPCAIVEFEALFEPEHGVGLLTDGRSILGTGYQMEVSPYGK